MMLLNEERMPHSRILNEEFAFFALSNLRSVSGSYGYRTEINLRIEELLSEALGDGGR